MKVEWRVILCSNDHFRKWASKCEVLSSPEMAMIDRLAGFHFQVTFNCDYSCPLLIWVVCAEVCFALIWNGTVYILKWFRPASKGSDHFEYFVVIWQTDQNILWFQWNISWHMKPWDIGPGLVRIVPLWTTQEEDNILGWIDKCSLPGHPSVSPPEDLWNMQQQWLQIF